MDLHSKDHLKRSVDTSDNSAVSSCRNVLIAFTKSSDTSLSLSWYSPIFLGTIINCEIGWRWCHHCSLELNKEINRLFYAILDIWRMCSDLPLQHILSAKSDPLPWPSIHPSNLSMRAFGILSLSRILCIIGSPSLKGYLPSERNTVSTSLASHTQTVMGYPDNIFSLYILPYFLTLSKRSLWAFSLCLAYSREVPSRGKPLGPGISCSDLTGSSLKVIVVVEKVEHRRRLCLNTLASFIVCFGYLREGLNKLERK